MNPIHKLRPELALAFTCVAAVGASMVRRFRMQDARECTRICRGIRLWTPPSPTCEVNDFVRALACLDALTRATASLVRRLPPLDDTETVLLRRAEAAMKSLRQDLASDRAAAPRPV